MNLEKRDLHLVLSKDMIEIRVKDPLIVFFSFFKNKGF